MSHLQPFRPALFALFSLYSLSAVIRADILTPSIISDHMVLQAEKSDAIWGWDSKNITGVKVSFIDSTGKVLATAFGATQQDASWSVRLDPLPTGATGTLQLEDGLGSKKIINDVVVGEVWLGSGQSNMEYHVNAGNAPPEMYATAQKEAAAAQPLLRYFYVNTKGADAPQDDVWGQWVVATPDTVGLCSSVAWNFAVALHAKLPGPVGVICSSVGATPVEDYMSKEALDATSLGAKIFQRDAERLAPGSEFTQKYEADRAKWEAANPTIDLQMKDAFHAPKHQYSDHGLKAPNRFYNGMIHGLEPFTLRGVLWFQSEAGPGEYAELIQALIRSWRKEWNDELPFYYVELNNWKQYQVKPVESDGETMTREGQAGALKLTKTDVVCSIDLGTLDPHFPNKKPVGQRLANLALEQVYGQQLGEVHSPQFAGYSIEGGKVRLKFDHADGLRTHDNGPLKGFAIRGASGDWVWADGKIDGNEIVVWSAQVPQPTAVRYAWAAYPIISVENGVGLPLRPFRTDTDSPQ